MFDIEATVTVATPTELKLTADWPIRWLEALGDYEIQRKVALKEILPEFDGTVKRFEISGDQARWPNLCVGDHVIVRLASLFVSKPTDVRLDNLLVCGVGELNRVD
jgi:hypothetical protein